VREGDEQRRVAAAGLPIVEFERGRPAHSRVRADASDSPTLVEPGETVRR
jgi:hypothetical protein